MPYMLDAKRPRTRASVAAQQALSLERPVTGSSDNFSTTGPAETLLEHAADSDNATSDDDEAPEETTIIGNETQRDHHLAQGQDLERVPVSRVETGVHGLDGAASESEAGTEEFHTAIEGTEEGEEFHTDSEDGSDEDEIDGDTEVQAVPTAVVALPTPEGEDMESDDDDLEDATLVPDMDGPPRLPLELLKAHNDRGSVELDDQDRLTGSTNKKRRRMRKNEIRRKRKQWLRLQKDMRAGVAEAGKAAQRKSGTMAAIRAKKGTKAGKMSYTSKPMISGRQRLLEDRKRAASGTARSPRDFKKTKKT